MRKLLCALAIVAVMASPVLAGGGSKATAELKVQNNATAAAPNNVPLAAVAAVIVDPPRWPYIPASVAEVTALAKLPPIGGGKADWRVKVGLHKVWIQLSDATGVQIGPAVTGSINVPKGGLSLVITNNVVAGIVVTQWHCGRM